MGQVERCHKSVSAGTEDRGGDYCKLDQESGLAGRAAGNNQRDAGGGATLKFPVAAGSQV